MRIIAVGGAGTIGRAVVEHLSAQHDVVVAGRTSGDVRVDISSPDSVRLMYEQVGAFDALVCTAGEAYFGPFEEATEEELALGVHSKLLGQIRLVLLGRSHISDGGSFTLISGYIFDDPIPEAVSFAVANGGVEGFVRAAALAVDRSGSTPSARGWPRTAPSSSAGSTRAAPPYPCPQSRPPSNGVWRAGVPEKSSGPGNHGHI